MSLIPAFTKGFETKLLTNEKSAPAAADPENIPKPKISPEFSILL